MTTNDPAQKTLDGKTDCRKARAKGYVKVKFTGKNQEILDGLKRVHKDYPCVKITVNGKKWEEGDNPP